MRRPDWIKIQVCTGLTGIAWFLTARSLNSCRDWKFSSHMFSSGCLLNCIFTYFIRKIQFRRHGAPLFLPGWNLTPLNSYHSPVASRFLALHPSFPPTTSSRSLFFPVITPSPLYFCLLPVPSFLFHRSHSLRHPPRFMSSFCPWWVLSLTHTHTHRTSTWTSLLLTINLSSNPTRER